MTPLVVLLLAPHLVDGGMVRLVSEGTGDVPVEWVLDGAVLGTTVDGEPLVIALPAGGHDFAAVARYGGEWQVLARPEPAGSGVTYVDAWTARHEPAAEATGLPDWLAPAAFASLAAVLWLWPSRSKNP